MRKETIRVIAGIVFCGLALSAPAVAKNVVVNPGVRVDLRLTVSGVHEVSADNPMPGLHLDANIKGRALDIYIAPMDFVAKYGIKVAKGDHVRIEGTELKWGGTDLVLARSITTGLYDEKTGAFREALTVYLRDDDGPLWDEIKAVAAHRY